MSGYSTRVVDIGSTPSGERNKQTAPGYQVGEVDVELSVPPAISVTLKRGPMSSESMLTSIYEANKGNDTLALVLGGLIQANKLRDKVKLATIVLKDTKIVLKATPSISLHWKEKVTASATGASRSFPSSAHRKQKGPGRFTRALHTNNIVLLLIRCDLPEPVRPFGPSPQGKE